MKKSLSFWAAALVIVSLSFLACQSSKSAPEADSYGSPAESGGTGSKTSKSAASGGGNFFTKLFSQKYEALDSTDIYTTTPTRSLKKQTADIVRNVKSGKIGWGSPYMLAYYYVTLEDEGRALFKTAVDTYLSDFENKKLNRNDSKSYKLYGNVPVRLEWGTIKSSTPNSGNGYAFLGYKFKQKSPYFSITIRAVGNEKRLNGDDTAEPESLPLNYFLTKAQATQLANLISDEYLGEFLTEVEADDAPVVQDEY